MSYPQRFPSDNPLVTVTHPTATTWVLEMHNGEDSRFTDHFINHAFMPALDAVERHWRQDWRIAKANKDKEGGKGTLVIVGKRGQDKFFSNGLDYDNIMNDPAYRISFFPIIMNPCYRRLIAFPIPTVAAINGHCFAGAMCLALCCDYRVMTDGSSRRAWMCMNEVHFGSGWPLSLAAITRIKVTDARVHRKIALEGHRFTPSEALEAGIIDYTVKGDTEAVIAKAQEVGESVSGMAREGSWGTIKRDLYRDLLEACARETRPSSVIIDEAEAKARL
ncbi:uncharacterized protein FIBRA_04940 [Fibroporia radiculosa]|uniref:Enoyl-CoA hydratase n=1 Tax=Fibroporia radiculosa TaxID=599839 RepID=J4G873_9APHY|nr:uncharacterized protein FIBRA_04940 [Fibroporia radiculosa]CCM02828.1 predicted protein [Fibroporia radiculosa]